MGEFEGEFTGTPFLASLRKGWALFAASSDPTGGRRPCPLRRRKLRASTAEQRGFFPLKKVIHPESLDRRIQQKIVAVDDFRIMGIAENGSDLMAAQAHDFAQFSGGIIGQPYA